TLVIGTIDNFLRPKLVGVRAGLHELLIFFSVLGGLRIWVALGVALGPVVVSITLALLEILRRVDSESQLAAPANRCSTWGSGAARVNKRLIIGSTACLHARRCYRRKRS